jgi:hypothetical protein
MIHLLRNRNFYLVLAADMAIFALSLLLAYTVRYAFAIPASEWRSILLVLPGCWR